METAAKLTAAATMKAACLQLFAATFVLVAAYVAAVRQVRLAEREHKAKVAAYKSRMTEIAVSICDHAFLNSSCTKSDEKIIRIWPLTVPEELRPSNWLDHALLGENVVTAISTLYSEAKRFVEFSVEMEGKPAEAQSEFGGAVGDEREPGIDTYREMNELLQKSATHLLSLLNTRENSASRSKPQPPSTPRRWKTRDNATLLLAAAPVLAIIAKTTGKFGETYIKQPFLAGKVTQARRAAAIMTGIVMSMFLLIIGCLIWLGKL